jgi:hypothetical protein
MNIGAGQCSRYWFHPRNSAEEETWLAFDRDSKQNQASSAFCFGSVKRNACWDKFSSMFFDTPQLAAG